MKPHKVKLANHALPTEWEAWGDNPQDALDNWTHCFGEGFELVDKPAQAVRR
jgi:hypothetical protein